MGFFTGLLAYIGWSSYALGRKTGTVPKEKEKPKDNKNKLKET